MRFLEKWTGSPPSMAMTAIDPFPKERAVCTDFRMRASSWARTTMRSTTASMSWTL